MRGKSFRRHLSACAFLLASALLVGAPRRAPGIASTLGLTIHSHRSAASDLEITGMVPDLPGNTTGYLRYPDLLRLPQTSATIDDDPDLPGITFHITGVYLADLARAAGAPPSADLMVATCTDGYRSHYPQSSIAQHHPLLVLTMDGLSPAAWAARTHQEDPGPYLILYKHFVPAFRILAHADRPQLPTNVMRLTFSSARAFWAITPPANSSSAAQQGFTIAKQNCLRCHAQGRIGGTKSTYTWAHLASSAATRPEFFAAYIKGPRASNPEAKMPPNPEYDAPTVNALSAYFSSLTPRAQRPQATSIKNQEPHR